MALSAHYLTGSIELPCPPPAACCPSGVTLQVPASASHFFSVALSDLYLTGLGSVNSADDPGAATYKIVGPAAVAAVAQAADFT